MQVWIDCEVTTESVAIYAQLINMGIDAFCTDFPLRVKKICDLYAAVKQDSKSAPEFAKRLRAFSNETEAEF